MSLAMSADNLDSDGVCLTLAGEIDLSSARELQQAIHAAVEDRSVRSVVVDLTDVSFIDSTGVATLINGRKLADACATSFRVVNPQDLVLRVLQITGVLAYLATSDVPPPRRSTSGPPRRSSSPV